MSKTKTAKSDMPDTFPTSTIPHEFRWLYQPGKHDVHLNVFRFLNPRLLLIQHSEHRSHLEMFLRKDAGSLVSEGDLCTFGDSSPAPKRQGKNTCLDMERGSFPSWPDVTPGQSGCRTTSGIRESFLDVIEFRV